MKNIITGVLLLMFGHLSCFAQDSTQPSKKMKLHCQAILTTDSVIQKGFLWKVTDSSIILSDKKRIMANAAPSQYISIPAENIGILTIKKSGFPWAEMTAGAVLGFVLTAGLWENEDINMDGKLSFWELLFGAIDGTSSQNRERRRVATWVGIGGGFAGLLTGAFSGRKLTISLPIGNRRNSLRENRLRIQQFLY